MAVPFLFPPVRIDGRWLVDGVVSDPLPVSAALDAHAVVTLGFAGHMPRRISRPSRLLAQASTALPNNLMRARLETAAARGQRLVPLELARDRQVGLWRTDALPELFEAGRRAAEARLHDILAIRCDTGCTGRPARPRAAATPPRPDPPARRLPCD